MTDIFEFMGTTLGALRRIHEDVAYAPRVALLVAAAVFVAAKVVFSWLKDVIATGEAMVLLVALLVAEAVAVRWVRDFGGLLFLPLLMLPVAIWGAAEVIARVGKREARRSALQADMRRYREALRRDPRNAAAREMLGDAHVKAGKLGLAIEEYRAALALEGTSYTTRYKLQRAERLAQAR